MRRKDKKSKMTTETKREKSKTKTENAREKRWVLIIFTSDFHGMDDRIEPNNCTGTN